MNIGYWLARIQFFRSILDLILAAINENHVSPIHEAVDEDPDGSGISAQGLRALSQRIEISPEI
ncbi:hypothetical protein ACFPP7_04435 [Polaromonas jejuensis]|uniref:Uncharacterized protein n=1 Tax=Polaromonas jejuensis TaxID=457502 RepID=A0ABW0Q6J2_9BURK